MIDVFWHLWIVCWVFYRSHLGFLKGLHLPVELAGCSVISDARASLYVQSVNAQQLKLGFFKCEGSVSRGKAWCPHADQAYVPIIFVGFLLMKGKSHSYV